VKGRYNRKHRIVFLKRRAPEIYLQKEFFSTYLWYTCIHQTAENISKYKMNPHVLMSDNVASLGSAMLSNTSDGNSLHLLLNDMTPHTKEQIA
jgi:hypothetical protein